MYNLKKILKFFKPYYFLAILAPIFMMLEVTMDLFLPKLLQRAIDLGIANGNTSLVISSGIKMISFSIISFAGGIACTYFASKTAINIAGDLREALFKKIQNFSFDNLDKFSTGHLITLLTNDVEQIQNLTLMSLRVMIRIPLTIVGSIIMAHYTSPSLVFIIYIAIPVLLISIALVLKLSLPIYKEVQSNLDKLNKVVQENLSGIRTVKAFVMSTFEKNRFNSTNDALKNKMISAGKIVAVEMPFMMLVINISILAVLYTGAYKLVDGKVQVGQIIAFVNYMQLMLMSLMFFAMLLVNVARSTVSIKRVVDVLDEKINISNSKNILKANIEFGNIEFKNVNFSYGKSNEKALKNINFKVQKGEFIGILGSTGSGKSTLMNILNRFYEVDNGSVEIDSVNIKNYDLQALRQNIAYVLQNNILFSGTIKDNIAFSNKDASIEEIQQVSKIAGIHDFIISLKDGYNEFVGQKGVNLSGGQKQRIAIARALLSRGKMLVLDDSTSAVDSKTEKQIQEEIKKNLKDTTCFVIAQKISSIINTDRIILMDKGEIIDIGKHEELIVRSKIYKEIYNSQLGGIFYGETSYE